MTPQHMTPDELAAALRRSYEDTRLAAIPRREALIAEVVRRQYGALIEHNGVRFERAMQPGALRCEWCMESIPAEADAIRAHVCGAWWEK